MGCMNVAVKCECGYRWESHSASGRTRCRGCGRRLYIPLQVRRNAGLVTQLSRSEPTLTQSGTRASIIPRASLPGRVASSGETPYQTPEPRPALAPSWPSWLVDAVTNLARSTPQHSPAAPPTSPVAGSTAMKKRDATNGMDRPATTGSLLVLDVACGCHLLNASPTPPAEIRCPIHGRAATRRSRRIHTDSPDARLPFGSPIG